VIKVKIEYSSIKVKITPIAVIISDMKSNRILGGNTYSHFGGKIPHKHKGTAEISIFNPPLTHSMYSLSVYLADNHIQHHALENVLTFQYGATNARNSQSQIEPDIFGHTIAKISITYF